MKTKSELTWVINHQSFEPSNNRIHLNLPSRNERRSESSCMICKFCFISRICGYSNQVFRCHRRHQCCMHHQRHHFTLIDNIIVIILVIKICRSKLLSILSKHIYTLIAVNTRSSRNIGFADPFAKTTARIFINFIVCDSYLFIPNSLSHSGSRLCACSEMIAASMQVGAMCLYNYYL